jgi:hypothetical protein
MLIQGVFLLGVFFCKNTLACKRTTIMQVQAMNVVHPGVDAVNCTMLSNSMCHTRA